VIERAPEFFSEVAELPSPVVGDPRESIMATIQPPTPEEEGEDLSPRPSRRV